MLMEESWRVQILATILIFKMAATWELYSAIESKIIRKLIRITFFHERTLEPEVSRLGY